MNPTDRLVLKYVYIYNPNFRGNEWRMRVAYKDPNDLSVVRDFSLLSREEESAKAEALRIAHAIGGEWGGTTGRTWRPTEKKS